MRGDVDTIKERLDIVEIVSGYLKLEKAGISFKARCPFHNEKTPSFFVSPVRQSFCCFGCGAKGDIFTFVEEIEGLDFRGALKLLAEKAGVEIKYHGRDESRTEKDKLLNVLEEAAEFFEKELAGNQSARSYITSRGLSAETIKDWRIGYAPAEWRALIEYLKGLGYDDTLLARAGLIKKSGDEIKSKEPYDVFRDRIMFPLADSNGSIIAFSGRALAQETEPKYLNSPDTILFTKGEVLHGLDKAKDQIRRKNYTVLVEGQIDLTLSHQSGIKNTVASSGTTFTRMHLERLKRLSPRIIIAFDGDPAGEKAAEKASFLGISLGLEVKVANLPTGLDPAEVIKKDPQKWRDILRESLPAVEFFFNKIAEKEKDSRKLGQQVEKKILPMIKLIESAIEQSHFISMLAKRTSIKETILWEDLKKVKISQGSDFKDAKTADIARTSSLSQQGQIEERLAEIKFWRQELPESSPENLSLKKEELELADNLSGLLLRDHLSRLLSGLAQAEASKDSGLIADLTLRIQEVHAQMRTLEEKKKIL
ncbi:MAG: DNA primase [Candidatus Zambryskibacteria bacterium]|nr:DNA primase [Candidatus Zambryskibacteria bacterium]